MDKCTRDQPLLIVFFALLLCSPLLTAQEPARVGVVAGLEGELSLAEGRLSGRFASFYQCLFAKSDRDFKFVEMPLAQVLYQLEKGGIAVGLPLVQTSERDYYADFGGRLFQTEYVYLFLENLPPLSQTSDLTYVFIRKFVGDKLVQGNNSKVLPVSEWRQAVLMLKRGRADVVVMPWVLVDKFMNGYDGEYHVRTAVWVDLSLYVSHKHDDSGLTEDLRHAIRHCRYQNDIN